MLVGMASKTAARSAARPPRLKANPRGDSGSARPSKSAGPRRKPARRKPARRNPSAVSVAGTAVGRTVRACWLMLAKGAGGMARSVGRARELEPGHRRDGVALALLGLGVVVAASSWFDAARPVGEWIDTFIRVLIGAAVVLVPIALAALGIGIMRTEPDLESRPRLILGTAMIVLPVLGLLHLWSGSPLEPDARQHAGGFIGFAMSGPLSDGLTAWIAAPLLVLGVLFGLLLLTRTTIREVPSTLRDMFSTRWGREYDDEYEDDEYEDEDRAGRSEDFSDGNYDDGNYDDGNYDDGYYDAGYYDDVDGYGATGSDEAQSRLSAGR